MHFLWKRALRVLVVSFALVSLIPSPLTPPAQAQTKTDWIWLGAGSALGYLAFRNDSTLRESLVHGAAEEYSDLASWGNRLGKAENLLVPFAATYAIGFVPGLEELRPATAHVFTAATVAGLSAVGLKQLFGRIGPPGRTLGNWHGPYDFRGPNINSQGVNAFPSGHTTLAFAIASAVSLEAKNPWATTAAYGTAAFVGWSRIYDDMHWTSDVIVGATLGTLAGRATVKAMHKWGVGDHDAARLTLSPNGEVGVHLPVSF